MRFARPPAPAPPVQAERLVEALARLRERTPAEIPPAPAAEPAPASDPAPVESAPVESRAPAEPASLADPPEPAEPAAPASPPASAAPTGPADPTAPADPAAPAEPPAPADAALPSRPAKPWLERPFRALAGSDPSAAGRLLLALLPAQRAADPQAVAYDLVLGDLVCARVTVGSGAIHVEFATAPRPAAEVDFQLVGDVARVARLLVAGPLRRRLPSRRRARIRGDRRRVAALDHLVGARLTLGELIAAGLKLDPLLTLTLASRAIDPTWTAGERFTLAHRDPDGTAPGAYLHVRDTKAPLVSAQPPHGRVTTVLVCPADDLLAVLAGRDARLEGDNRPLVLLRQWLDRAQCG